MRSRLVAIALLISTAATAAGQVRPIFDPDDFIDPRNHAAPLFISRLVAGAMRSAEDDYRPLRQDAGFLYLVNSFYFRHFQADYKHSEVRGEQANGPGDAQVCPCDPPIYFSQTGDRMTGSKDTLQLAGYWSVRGDPSEPRAMLRYRLSISRRKIDTDTTFLETGHDAGTLHGHEQSISVDADTYFRIAGRGIFGTLFLARTKSSGTAADHSQNEIAYVVRPPGTAIGNVLMRATLTVGAVTGRSAAGLNVINPAFEAMRPMPHDVSIHLIWSPLATRTRENGWTTHQQLLVSLEYVLFAKSLTHFRPSRSD